MAILILSADSNTRKQRDNSALSPLRCSNSNQAAQRKRDADSILVEFHPMSMHSAQNYSTNCCGKKGIKSATLFSYLGGLRNCTGSPYFGGLRFPSSSNFAGFQIYQFAFGLFFELLLSLNHLCSLLV